MGGLCLIAGVNVQGEMTNLKSVGNYSIPARDAFVLWDCTNGRVNSMKFIAFTAVPNVIAILPGILLRG